MLLAGRTQKYAVWRACERFAIRPPGIPESLDEISPPALCDLLAYDQVRSLEQSGTQQNYGRPGNGNGIKNNPARNKI